MDNVLLINNRKAFREWLKENHLKEKECFIPNLKRGKPDKEGAFYYIDAVEEALCFGWIDGLYKKVDGVLYQRFSPRVKNSSWTVLNIARVKRLEKLGLMTPDGLKCLQKEEIALDPLVIADIKSSGVYEAFMTFPELYRQIRVSNLASTKKISIEKYKSSLTNFIKMTKEGKMTSGWDDYGRLK